MRRLDSYLVTQEQKHVAKGSFAANNKQAKKCGIGVKTSLCPIRPCLRLQSSPVKRAMIAMTVFEKEYCN